MKIFWQRIKASLEAGVHQQVTRIGLIFALTTALVGLAAFASANNLLFLLLAALLSTFLVSGFVSRLGLAGLELDLQMPEHIAARRKMVGQLILKNTKFWMPSFSIELSGSPESGFGSRVYIPVVPGRNTLKEPVELMFKRRGLFRENAFFLSSRFPFGFTQRRALVTLKHDTIVYPCIDPQPGFEQLLDQISGEVEARQRGRGHDFYRIRPYEALESARHVDWKATAHTGDLQVREFAREHDQTVTIVLDLEIQEIHRAWFERAVDCCAFLVWRLSRGELRLRFVTQQFDMRVPEEADVYTILRYLALVAPVKGVEIPALHDEQTFEIAITARPSRFLSSDILPDRVVTVDDLPVAGPADTAGGACNPTS